MNAERGLCEGYAPNLHEAAFHSELMREAGAAREPGAGGGAGATMLKEGPCTLHSTSCHFNDRLIRIGGRSWVQLAERALDQG